MAKISLNDLINQKLGEMGNIHRTEFYSDLISGDFDCDYDDGDGWNLDDRLWDEIKVRMDFGCDDEETVQEWINKHEELINNKGYEIDDLNDDIDTLNEIAWDYIRELYGEYEEIVIEIVILRCLEKGGWVELDEKFIPQIAQFAQEKEALMNVTLNQVLEFCEKIMAKS